MACRRRPTVTPEIRIAGPEALPAFVALAEAQADWLWARGIRQWTPGSIRAEQGELARKLARGWLVTAVVPGDEERKLVAGCLLTSLATSGWQDREASAAYIERLAVARAFAGRGLSQAIVAACADLARESGLDVLRLDCWDGNETLKALYRNLEFREVAEVIIEDYGVTLFERRLHGRPRA